MWPPLHRNTRHVRDLPGKELHTHRGRDPQEVEKGRCAQEVLVRATRQRALLVQASRGWQAQRHVESGWRAH